MAEAKSNELSTVTLKTGFDSSDDEGEINASPFNISWLELNSGEGDDRLGISGLPGCRFKDTWRSLEHDIKSLQSEGVGCVFSLCSKGELNKYRAPNLLTELTTTGIDVHHYPFLDGTAPNIATMLKIVDDIVLAVRNGKSPLVHCFGGLGRSCLVAVCTLLILDESLKAEEAISKVRELRGPGAIQSVKQYNYACEYRSLMKTFREENESEARSISR